MRETIPIVVPWQLAEIPLEGRPFEDTWRDYLSWEDWMSVQANKLGDTLGEEFRVPFADLTEEQRIALHFIMGLACNFAIASARQDALATA